MHQELKEEGIKQEPKATSSQGARNLAGVGGGMADATFRGIGDVLKLLPAGTVIVYKVLIPIVTNGGECGVANKAVTAVLLAVLAFSCAFSAFTDSYVRDDGRVKYGLVTAKGLLPFGDSGAARRRDFSTYKLRAADFVHAFFSVAVFAAVALLADASTVACFYPALKEKQKQVIMALPIVVGVLASVVFVVFPSTRSGIGYPPPKPAVEAQKPS